MALSQAGARDISSGKVYGTKPEDHFVGPGMSIVMHVFPELQDRVLILGFAPAGPAPSA